MDCMHKLCKRVAIVVLTMSAPAAVAEDTLFHDSHFHLTNYVQQGTDIEEIKTAMEKVGTATSALGASMYAQAQAEQQEAGGEAGADGDEDIVEAEIIDEDEDK